MISTAERRENEVENLEIAKGQLDYAQSQLDWVDMNLEDDSDLRSLVIAKFRVMVGFGVLNDLDTDFDILDADELVMSVESLKVELTTAFQDIQTMINALRSPSNVSLTETH
jgi:hypothetical protein